MTDQKPEGKTPHHHEADLFSDLPGTPLLFQAAIGLPSFKFPLALEQISCHAQESRFLLRNPTPSPCDRAPLNHAPHRCLELVQNSHN
jgi:hypothetical protein